MTETGLLIAQAAVLLLLFGFVVAVVRSAGRQLNRAVPPPLPLEDPVDRDTAAHAIPVPAAAPAAPAFPDEEPWPPPHDTDPGPEPFTPVATEAAVTAPADALPPVVPVVPVPPHAGEDGDEHDPDAWPPAPQGQGDGTFLDLSSNLQPRLVVEAGPGLVVGTVFPLGQGLTIGRSRSNELHVDDTFVSHMHARILKRGPFYYVEDLGSTNGTFVNDGRVDTGAQLRVRDTLRMGETILRYEE